MNGKIVNSERNESNFVEIYIIYREPKQLEEIESEMNFLEKTVKVSKDAKPVRHLISIFEELGKDEFKVKETFSKRLNLESLFYWKNLSKEQRIELMKDLFLDFIRNGLYGRSKERTKLILLIDLTPLNYGIALIQTTITGKEIKIVKTKEGEILKDDERFLDEDNIYRFVYFYAKEDETDRTIYFRTHQRSYSKYFIRWLQIEEVFFDITQELDFSFLCHYENFVIQINMDEETLVNIIDNPHNEINLDVDNNCLVIERVRFKIRRIRIKGAKKEFKNLVELLEYLRKRKCNLDLIERKFTEAVKTLEHCKDLRIAPLIYKEDSADIIEDENVISVGSIRIDKRMAELPDSRIILIVSNVVSTFYKPEFLSKVCSDIRNGKIIRVMSIHLPIVTNSNKTIRVGPLLLYNRDIKLSKELMMLAKIYEEEYGNLPQVLRDILVAVILDYLSKEIRPLSPFFKQLLQNYLNCPFSGTIFYLESRLVEYKRPEILYGDRDKVTTELYKEIIKKLKDKLVIFVIGIDGKSRKIIPIDAGRINDDACREILDDVKGRLEKDGVILSEPFFIPVNSGLLLTFYAKKESTEEKQPIFPNGW